MMKHWWQWLLSWEDVFEELRSQSRLNIMDSLRRRRWSNMKPLGKSTHIFSTAYHWAQSNLASSSQQIWWCWGIFNMQRNYLPLATYEPTNLYLFIILSCVSHWAHTRLVAHVMHSVPWSASTSRPTDPHSECLSVPMSAAAESKDRGTQWLWEGLVVVSGKSQDGFPIFPAFP